MYAVGAPEAISRESNLMYSNPFKQSDVESIKYREYFTTDLNQSQPPISGGGGSLARYRSAPSSSFASLVEERFEDLLGSGDAVPYDMQFPAPAVKQEMAVERQGQRQYPVYQEDVGGVYRDASGVGSNLVQVQGKIGGLARQSSSPAGFFSNVAIDNGFPALGDMENFRAANNAIYEKSSPLINLNFSSGMSTTSRYMPQIAENGNNSNNNIYLPSFQNDSWNETNLNDLKRSRESEDKFSGFNPMNTQSGENGNYANRLTHHPSLPKTSGEMAAMEKYLQFQQDAVPCKIRAKRGCATHPRSIAERMRRTRISARMKKLQDLFPNMDKQTNTAEMLDLAVEYIKDLQNQVQILTGKKAKCTCSE